MKEVLSFPFSRSSLSNISDKKMKSIILFIHLQIARLDGTARRTNNRSSLGLSPVVMEYFKYISFTIDIFQFLLLHKLYCKKPSFNKRLIEASV